MAGYTQCKSSYQDIILKSCICRKWNIEIEDQKAYKQNRLQRSIENKLKMLFKNYSRAKINSRALLILLSLYSDSHYISQKQT